MWMSALIQVLTPVETIHVSTMKAATLVRVMLDTASHQVTPVVKVCDVIAYNLSFILNIKFNYITIICTCTITHHYCNWFSDIDECQSGRCGGHDCCGIHTCVNTQGSYHCQCKPGYVPDRKGKNCIGERCYTRCINILCNKKFWEIPSCNAFFMTITYHIMLHSISMYLFIRDNLVSWLPYIL